MRRGFYKKHPIHLQRTCGVNRTQFHAHPRNADLIILYFFEKSSNNSAPARKRGSGRMVTKLQHNESDGGGYRQNKKHNNSSYRRRAIIPLSTPPLRRGRRNDATHSLSRGRVKNTIVKHPPPHRASRCLHSATPPQGRGLLNSTSFELCLSHEVHRLGVAKRIRIIEVVWGVIPPLWGGWSA